MQIFLHIFKYIMKKGGKIVQLIIFIITFVPENIENKPWWESTLQELHEKGQA